ncbi:hypothetical protein EMPG_17738 [Blastomyces silverae]|uniref:Uncharacterized protein n=1 Tax=Blastomyces silverae TaxID=2060906 RepID=A0A0H1B5P6_9EURO|nr:hypothetical protein EMPG_17738 [Blastomyces silverae]
MRSVTHGSNCAFSKFKVKIKPANGVFNACPGVGPDPAGETQRRVGKSDDRLAVSSGQVAREMAPHRARDSRVQCLRIGRADDLRITTAQDTAGISSRNKLESSKYQPCVLPIYKAETTTGLHANEATSGPRHDLYACLGLASPLALQPASKLPNYTTQPSTRLQLTIYTALSASCSDRYHVCQELGSQARVSLDWNPRAMQAQTPNSGFGSDPVYLLAKPLPRLPPSAFQQ